MKSITPMLLAAAALTQTCSAGTLALGKASLGKEIIQTTDKPKEGPATVFGSTFFDELKAKKDAAGIPITLGAWHWFRFGDQGPGSNGYGQPGLRGTYYWTVDLDPKLKLDGPNVTEVGLHSQIRLREDGLFRGFIDNDIWPWEAYLYAKTAVGTFKAGQIWKRFGMDWDGVFYGNVAYFDGFKLDPDLGVSWEQSFEQSKHFKIDATAQCFLKEDGINGSLVGSDAESSDGLTERNTGLLRLVPTWQLSSDSSLAIGVSGMVGQVDSDLAGIGDDTYAAYAIDATYTKGNFKIFGEILQSFGTIHPNRYVSGGPSDQITDYLVGASYKTGPVTWRANYSAGYDKNPGGEQSFFLPGATIALTPNVDLYLEYVKWTVTPDNGPKATYEDGYQVALNWRF
jgi:hypothetical protein